MKAGGKIQVLTFSLDNDPARVERYMKEKQYTFPVIVDGDLAQKVFGAGAIPQPWIIDREGRLSQRFQSWSLGKILYEIERLAARP